MENVQQYSAVEMERMMKLQDVLLKAMAKKITWWEAAEIIGVTDRTMRRWREKLEEHGYSELADGRKGKASLKRVPLSVAEEVLRLYRETYYDLNIKHFHEKLQAEHQIELSYTWVHWRCKERVWWPRRASAASIVGGESAGRWQGCCCISTEATSVVWRSALARFDRDSR